MAKGHTESESARFLREAFGDAPPDANVLVWTFPQRVSSWYGPGEYDDAAGDVEQWEDRDVYVGVGLSPRDYGPKQRCAAADIIGVAGLWADIDYVDPAHKKANLPPDEESALALVKAMGPEPSVVVHSGHGIQAWWLFTEPWIFEGQAEYEEAARLAVRWNHTLKVRAAEHGWVVDSVFDMARVMRLPGTTNCKREPRVPVRVLAWNEVRHNPSDFEDYLADETALRFLSAPYRVGELKVQPLVEPGYGKLTALLDNSRKAKAVWERSGTQLPSASEWDLALASHAVMGGWEDQEIADLLIAYRRKHGEEPKNRQDYLARTIAKARTGRLREEQDEQMAEVLESAIETLALEPAGPTPSPDALRAKRELTNVVSARLGGIPLARIERAVSDPVVFTFVFLNDRRLGIGDGGALASSYVKIAGLVEAETRVPVPMFKRTEWKDVASAIIHASEDVAVSEEATDAGLAVSALSVYLRNRPLLTDRNDAAEAMEPFVEAGVVYVFSSAFAAALERRGERLLKGVKLDHVMRAAGCEYLRHFNVRVNGRKSQRSVWVIPGSVVEELALDLPATQEPDDDEPI